MAAINEGLRENDENTYLMDIACWTYQAYYDGILANRENDEERARFAAKWQEVIDNYEQAEMTESQKKKFLKRRTDFQERFKTAELFPAIQKLIEEDAPTGHYLLARYFRYNDGFGPEVAFNHLDGNEVKPYVFGNDSIKADPVLFRLYYRLWWESHTKDCLDSEQMVGFFYPDRAIVLPNFNWTMLLDLARRRCSFEGESDNWIGLFHQAWSLFQLREIDKAKKIFQYLDNNSYESIRRGRSLAIISGENEKPAVFQGSLKIFGEQASRSNGGFKRKGQVYWPEYRTYFPCNPTDFPGKSNGSQIDFCVSLNYIGCFAVSESRARIFLLGR